MTNETQRVEVRVSITVGDEAVVEHPGSGPIRMPAAVIARDADLPENELPGRCFTAVEDGDELRDFRLLNDPRI